MKKVFNCLVVVLFAALSVVSCLPDSDYSHSSVVTADFEYLFVDFDADSLFYKSEKGSGIGWGSLGFMHKIDTVNWKFEGGLLLSRQKGTRYDSADKVALSKEESEVFAKDRFRVNSVKDSLKLTLTIDDSCSTIKAPSITGAYLGNTTLYRQMGYDFAYP